MTFEEYISGMSVRDLVTHLLCPAIRSTYKDNSDPREYFDWIFADKTIKPGSVFFFPSKKEDITAMAHKMKEYLGTMPLIAMDPYFSGFRKWWFAAPCLACYIRNVRSLIIHTLVW